MLLFVYSITECVRLEGTTGGYLVQPPCSNRIIPEHMCRVMYSKQFLNIFSEGESTISLLQCSVPCTIKKSFFILRWNFLCINFCPLPLHLFGVMEKNLDPSSWYLLFRYMFTLARFSLCYLFLRPNRPTCK